MIVYLKDSNELDYKCRDDFMTRAAGIDPGTKSMDICAIADGKVYYENPFDNLEALST